MFRLSAMVAKAYISPHLVISKEQKMSNHVKIWSTKKRDWSKVSISQPKWSSIFGINIFWSIDQIEYSATNWLLAGKDLATDQSIERALA